MNNRNHVCPTCRTVTRGTFVSCRVCGKTMRRVNHVPKRSDDAGWARIAVELRDRDEAAAAREWRRFVQGEARR